MLLLSISRDGRRKKKSTPPASLLLRRREESEGGKVVELPRPLTDRKNSREVRKFASLNRLKAIPRSKKDRTWKDREREETRPHETRQ